MTEFLDGFNRILGIATLLAQVGFGVLLLFYFFKSKNALTKLVSTYALEITVAILGAGTFLSLFYSEVLHVPPCSLCWYQRIFIYAGVIIGAVGLWKKDKKILDYIAVLIGLCLLVGIYNYYIQWGGSPLLPCSTSSLVASCEDKRVLEFGYITIPLMSVTSSALVLLVYGFFKRTKN